MSTRSFTPELPWNISPEERRRFRKILLITLLIFLVLSIVMPLLPVPEPDEDDVAEVPPRLARLILERKQQEPPPPPPEPEIAKPEEKPAEEPKPEEKQPEEQKAEPEPEPEPEPPPPPQPTQQTARDVAQQSGVLAFADSFADLRDNKVLDSITSQSVLTTEGSESQQTQQQRSIVTAGVSEGSGGINTAALSTGTGSGTTLQGRATSKVESTVGTGSGGGGAKNTSGGQSSSGGASGTGRLAGRSEENVQIVFDRNKSKIYNVYNRALRSNPSLQGKVVLSLTIAPSGKVTKCTIVSSELNDPALEKKLVQRVKLLNFGPAEVATTTISYPIDFFPA